MFQKRQMQIVREPDSRDEIDQLVKRLLHEADAFDVFPTPMDRLFEIADVVEVATLPDPDTGFIKSLTGPALGVFLSAIQKIRGIADLRERVVYVPRRDDDPRILFAQGHELGHQAMTWHNIRRAYQDDNTTLSPTVAAMFEREANYFSGQAIFKGDKFKTRSRDFVAEFTSIFKLAADHGASIQATTWRFIQAQDISVGVVYYYPDRNAFDECGNHPLARWRVVPSPKFAELCEGGIDLPAELPTGHPWLAARNTNDIVSGQTEFECGLNGRIRFIWQAWWNTHCLSVLIRRKPLFRLA